MINVSNEFKETMQYRTDFKSYAQVTFSDGETLTLDSSQFTTSNNSILDGTGSSSFPLGIAVQKVIQIEILNDADQYKDYIFLGAKIRLYLDFKLSTKTERIEKGTYTVITPETYGETVIITAYDDMHKADKDYTTKLTFPQTAKAVLRDICSTCDITLGSTSFLHDDLIIQNEPTGKFREIIGYIAMIACGNARIDTSNRLQIVSYDFSGYNTTGKYHTLKEWSNPKIEYNDSMITGFKTVIQGNTSDDNVEMMVGTDTYTITIENQLIAGHEETVLTWLKESLGNKPFRPFSGDLVSNPLIEFMDLVKLQDRKGNLHNSFVTDVNFLLPGYTTVKNSSPGMAKSELSYANAALKTEIRTKKLIEQEKTDRELSVDRLYKALKESSGMYSTEEVQPNGSTIYYLHDKPTINESKNVMKLTAEAIGFSMDGGNTYPFGFTIDGELIMRIIQTEGLNADWITAGAFTIRDDNGNIIFTADKDTKQVLISGDSVRIGGTSATNALNNVLSESKDYSDGKLADYANVVSKDFASMQAQIDGQIETFYYDYEPTLQNIPASQWTTTEERKKHEGDLFYWKSKGYAYRFFQDGAAWKWQLVQDTDITQAMAQAEKAQDTADGKRRVFVVTPQPPYDIGDLWTNGEDILTCAVSRAEGSTYVSSDWQKLNKYTDDTLANEALEEARKSRALNVILDNEYQGIPTDYQGNYTTFPTVQTGVQVFYGHTDVSTDCSYSIQKSSGITGTWNNSTRTYTVTALSADTGWVDITASYLSLFTTTKRFNIAKNKGGMPGENGTQGINLILNSSFSENLNKWNQEGGPEITTMDGYPCLHISGSMGIEKRVYQSVFDKTSMDEVGQLYTISADIKLVNYVAGTKEPYVALYISGSYDNNGTSTWLGATAVSGIGGASNLPPFNNQGWKRVHMVFKFAQKPTSMSIYVYGRDFTGDLYVKNYKMEKGAIENTIWTPAIEDLQGPPGLQGIQGEQGLQGIPGKNGTDGKTSYFHIKYSLIANPTLESQMTETPSTYIGTYVDYIEEDSTDPKKYTWARFQGLQGENGENGIPGKNGTDGKTSYLHIKYSNDGGKTFTSNNGETPGDYIGQYVDFTQADSTNVSSYTWSKTKGEQGTQGINLLENSSFSGSLNKWTATGAQLTTMDGYPCLHISGSMGIEKRVYQSVFDKTSMDEVGQLYTISADIKLVNYVAGTKEPYVALYISGSYDNNGTSTWLGATAVSGIGVASNLPPFNNQGWKRVHMVFKFAQKPTSMSIYVYGRDFTGDLYVKNYKMEKGAIENTIWTPAIEDLQGRTYFIELSANILKRGQNNVIVPSTITANSYYRDGTSATRTAYAGRWKIEISTNGTSWTTATTSTVNESSKSYSVNNLSSSIVAVRFTLYAADGTTDALDMQTIPIVIDVAALTHDQIFDLLTNNGAIKGIYKEGNQLYISFTYAKGGELTLGGTNNGNGKLVILNASGSQVGYIDNTGVHFNQGTFTGSVYANNGTLGNWIISENEIYNNTGYGNNLKEIRLNSNTGTIVSKLFNLSTSDVETFLGSAYIDGDTVGGENGEFENLTVPTKATIEGDFMFKDYIGSVRKPIASTATQTARVAYMGSQLSNGTYCLNVSGTWSGSTYSSKKFNATTSDIRLKEHIKPTTVESLPILNQIKLYEFDYIEDHSHQKIGFIADYLEELDSKFAIGGGYDEDGNMDTKIVNDFYLLGFVVKSIQELSKENEELKRRIEIIEERLGINL